MKLKCGRHLSPSIPYSISLLKRSYLPGKTGSVLAITSFSLFPSRACSRERERGEGAEVTGDVQHAACPSCWIDHLCNLLLSTFPFFFPIPTMGMKEERRGAISPASSSPPQTRDVKMLGRCSSPCLFLLFNRMKNRDRGGRRVPCRYEHENLLTTFQRPPSMCDANNSNGSWNLSVRRICPRVPTSRIIGNTMPW